MPLGLTNHTTAPVVPSRDFALLLGAVQRWVDGIACGGPCSGLCVLEGGREAGAELLLQGLVSSASGLGLRAQWIECASNKPIAGLVCAELAWRLVAAGGDGNPDAVAGGGALSSLERDRMLLRRIVGADACAGGGAVAALPALSAEDERWRLREAVVRSVLRDARVAPTILAFDGADNADSFTQDVIRRLVECITSEPPEECARLLVILTHSGPAPTLDRAFAAAVAAGRPPFSIQLRGYSREDIGEAVRRRFATEISGGQRERLQRAAAGDVGYLNWLLRSIQSIEELDAVLEEGAGDPGRLVVQAFDRLEAADRDVVVRVAALGSPTDAAALAAWEASPPFALPAGSASVSDLATRCARLVKSGWLWSYVADARVSTVRLGINAAVEREVLAAQDEDVWLAYHEQAVRVLMKTSPGSAVTALRVLDRLDPLLLAAAGGLGKFLLDSTLTAVRYLADLALAEDAVGLIERALALAADGFKLDHSARLQLEDVLADLLDASGSYEEAIEVVRARMGREQDSRTMSLCLRRVGDLYGRLGERKEQWQAYAQGMESARSLRDTELLRQLLAAMARVQAETGHAAKALDLCDEVERLLAEEGLVAEEHFAGTCGVREEIHLRRAELDAARDQRERLLRLARYRGDLTGTLESLDRLASIHTLRGDLSEAEKCIERLVALALEADVVSWTAVGWERLGTIRLERGDGVSAQQALRRAAAAYAVGGTDDAVLRNTARLIEADLRCGCHAQAAEGLREYLQKLGVQMERESQWGRSLPHSVLANESVKGCDARAGEKLAQRAAKRAHTLRGAELVFAAHWLEERGRLGEALAVLESALLHPDMEASAALRADARLRSAWIAHLSGEPAKAARSIDLALGDLSRCPDRDKAQCAVLEVGGILLQQGAIERALDCLLRGWRWLTCDERGALAEADGILTAARHLIEVLLEIGEAGAAVRAAEAACDLARTRGSRDVQLRALTLLSRARSESGDSRGASAALEEAGPMVAAGDRPLARALFGLERGWEQFRRHEFAAALEDSRLGIELCRSMGARLLLDEFLLLLGAVEVCSDNSQKNFLRGLETLERVASGAGERGRPRLAWEASLRIAAVFERRGAMDLARDHKVRALSWARHAAATSFARSGEAPWRARSAPRETHIEGAKILGSPTPACLKGDLSLAEQNT